MLVHEAEQTSRGWGGETSRKAPLGRCWLGKELGRPKPKASGPLSAHLHTCWAQWLPGDHRQLDPAGMVGVPAQRPGFRTGCPERLTLA